MFFLGEISTPNQSIKDSAMLARIILLSEPSTGTGVIRAVMPRVKKILKILEPIILPRIISVWCFLAAAMHATSSGSDVPGPTINNPMIWSSKP